MALEQKIQEAKTALDTHLKEIIEWHFSPETGSPFWLSWANQQDWDPRKEVRSIEDLKRFPHFDDNWLRSEPNERWVPEAYKGKPFMVFETGGTTGLPKQRVSWVDHLHDYTEFSHTLSDDHFPRGSNWLMMGPTGPRRLRLTIEHLANIRGGSCYFVDLDPRWVKRMISEGDARIANRYKEHVIAQGVELLKHRNIECLFTTPKLLESLAERIRIPGCGIKGVFCGGTTMTPQDVRFLIEEILEGKAQLVPTYGNTLMGLACSLPPSEANGFHVSYYAPQPRAVIRLVDGKDTERTVDYEEYGRVELTTLTREFFMPRFLERDEAIRREPCEQWPWDGAGEVRPFQAMQKKVIEGVY